MRMMNKNFENYNKIQENKVKIGEENDENNN